MPAHLAIAEIKLDPQGKAQLNARLDHQLVVKAKLKAQQEGTTLVKVLTALLRDYVGQEEGEDQP